MSPHCPNSPGFFGLDLAAFGRWLAIISFAQYLAAIFWLFFLFSRKPGHSQTRPWKGTGRGSKNSDCHLQAHRRPAEAYCLFFRSSATVTVSKCSFTLLLCSGENKNGVVINVHVAYNQGCPLVPVKSLFDYEQGGSWVVVRGNERRHVPVLLTSILLSHGHSPFTEQWSQDQSSEIDPRV